MASPELEREPGGIFIRYATVHDMDEIKSKLDRQDVKLDAIIAELAEIKSRQNVQDAKLDIIIAELADIKSRQDAQEAKTNRHRARMYRLLYALLAAAAVALVMFALEAFF